MSRCHVPSSFMAENECVLGRCIRHYGLIVPKTARIFSVGYSAGERHDEGSTLRHPHVYAGVTGIECSRSRFVSLCYREITNEPRRPQTATSSPGQCHARPRAQL